MLFIISGIAMFMIHNTAVQAVAGAEGPTSVIMQHAPMNTMIAVCSAALKSLYQQTITIGTILLIYHLAFNPVDIFKPIGLAGMFLLSWFTGVAIGMVFFGVNTMAPATRENSFDGLSSGEHAGIRQNVRCQYTAILHVGHV